MALFANMERSIVVEEDHCKSNCNTASKSEGSFIQIDSISIDLVSAKDKSDAGKCEHFSIRGYVSEIRKKDWKICCPFSLEGDRTESEEQPSFLPPLDVPKCRWWRCQNCLREVAGKGAAKDYGTLINCSSKCRSNSTCSHVSSLGSAAVLLPGFQQAPKLVLDGRSVDANTSTKLSNDNHILLCSDDKENKAELANTFIGNDIGSEENVNQEMARLTSAALVVNSRMIQRSNTDETVALKSSNGSTEFYEPRCGSHLLADVELADRKLKCVVKDSAEHCKTGAQTSPDDQHIESTEACQIVGLGSMIDEARNTVKTHTTRNPSLELDECDYEASETAEIMVGDDLLDHHLDKSSGLHRRKTPKVRLLTELLGKSSDAKSEHIETDDPPSNGIPSASGGLVTLSVPQGQVAIQGNVKRSLIQNRKRKPLDEEWRPPEMTSSNNSNKKAQTWKGDAETTVAIVGSESEDAFTETGLKTDRSSTVGKKKNKKAQDVGAYLSLAPPQVNVQKEIQDKIGNTSKSNAADGVSFRLAHDAFTGREIDTFPFVPLRTEKKSKMCKKKNKNPQVDGGEASLFPFTDSMIRNDPITPKNVDVMQTGSLTVPFQSAQDSSTEKGLHLSLNSFLGVQRYDKEFIRRVEDGLPSLSPCQEHIPRVDPALRKHIEINSAGDSSVPSKSPTDAFSGKGLNYDVRRKITSFRMPFLNETQNCTSWVEDGGRSQIHQMGYSGASNIDKSITAQEHSAVEKKHRDKKADKASEQGALDDIPMEIVELMAKNQYERGLQDADNKKRLFETTNNTGNGRCTNLNQLNFGRMQYRINEEYKHNRMLQLINERDGVTTTDKNVGATKQKSVDYFSPINTTNQLNVARLEYSLRTFAQSQKKQLSGVQFSATSSSSHSSGQNCKWNGGMVGHGPSSLQALGGCNTQQTAPKQSEAALHLWPNMIPNQMPFGYNMPQKNVAPSTNIDMVSQFPSSLHKGHMNSNHDLKFLNLNATSLERKMNLASETFGRNNADYPSACKHNGIGLPQNLMGSLDLYSNDTIPAMHLLSLMDPGMRSSPTFNIGGTSKFPKRPSFPHDHNSEEFPRIEVGAYKPMDSIKHPSSDYCGNNHFSEKSHGCFHCTPTVGASPSFQHDKGFQRATSTDFPGQVALKTQNKDKRKSSKSPTQSRGRRSENYAFPTAGLGTDLGAIPVHSLQKRFLGSSDSPVFNLQHHGMENPTQRPKSSSVSEICSVNRNPADFSKPEAGNQYMIRGEDLKFGKATPQSKHALVNLDGRKRHRNLKQTTVKERVQH